SENIPAQAPDFFFVDIQNNDIGDFKDLLSNIVPDGKLTSGPMLRGRIIELNGQNVRDMKIPPEAAWVLRGGRGLTFAEQLPENSTLGGGKWWPENYDGEPLVSFAEREGKELVLQRGDTVTINVLGRTISAKIASCRQVQWETLAMNFVMVFSPNTFAGAPATWLATLAIPEDQKTLAPEVLRQVTKTWP